MKKLADIKPAQRGSVLMEYVLVTAILVTFFIGATSLLSSPGTRAFNMEGAVEGDDFGFLGDAYVRMCRKVMRGVGSPLP